MASAQQGCQEHEIPTSAAEIFNSCHPVHKIAGAGTDFWILYSLARFSGRINLKPSSAIAAVRNHLFCTWETLKHLAALKAAAEHAVIAGFPAPPTEQARQKTAQYKSGVGGNPKSKSSKTMVRVSQMRLEGFTSVRHPSGRPDPALAERWRHKCLPKAPAALSCRY